MVARPFLTVGKGLEFDFVAGFCVDCAASRLFFHLSFPNEAILYHDSILTQTFS